jgi:hypothetical protein
MLDPKPEQETQGTMLWFNASVCTSPAPALQEAFGPRAVAQGLQLPFV